MPRRDSGVRPREETRVVKQLKARIEKSFMVKFDNKTALIKIPALIAAAAAAHGSRKLFCRRKREKRESEFLSCFPFVTNKRNSCERTSVTGLLPRRSFEAGNGKGGGKGSEERDKINQ